MFSYKALIGWMFHQPYKNNPWSVKRYSKSEKKKKSETLPVIGGLEAKGLPFYALEQFSFRLKIPRVWHTSHNLHVVASFADNSGSTELKCVIMPLPSLCPAAHLFCLQISVKLYKLQSSNPHWLLCKRQPLVSPAGCQRWRYIQRSTNLWPEIRDLPVSLAE